MKKSKIIIIISLLLLSSIALNIPVERVSAWHGNWVDWSYYRIITVDSTKVENLTRYFPVLVVINDTIGDKCQDDGGDLRFINTDNGTGADYHYEIEKWVDNEDRIVWVEIPVIDNLADTKVIMYYGNLTVGNGWNIPHTWNSDYEAVWHMHNMSDSTVNNHDFTDNHGVDFVSGISGAIGNCSFFNRTEMDWFNLSTDGIDLRLVDKTLECSFNITEINDAGVSDFLVALREDMGVCLQISDYTPESVVFVIQSSGNNPTTNYSGPTLETWYHTIGIHNAGATQSVTFFVNGSYEDEDIQTSTETDKNEEDMIGTYSYALKERGFYGYMDEIRLSKVLRNESWINTTYFSTTNNLITISSERVYTGQNSTPEFSNPNPANKSTSVPISTSTWNITIKDQEGDTFNWTIETKPNVGSNSANGASNGSKSTTLSGLAYSTNYTVYVNATDLGSGNWTNRTFWFVTVDSLSSFYWQEFSFGASIEIKSDEPYIYDESPTNGSTGVEEGGMYLSISVEEYQGEKFNITWTTNATSWIAYNSSCDSGTYYQYVTWADSNDTTYWWNVSVNDTNGNWNNKTFHFTTMQYGWSNYSVYWKIGHTSIYDPSRNMIVNIVDVTAVTSYYGDTGSPGWIPEDINDDGEINYIDVSGIANHYGEDYT